MRSNDLTAGHENMARLTRAAPPFPDKLAIGRGQAVILDTDEAFARGRLLIGALVGTAAVALAVVVGLLTWLHGSLPPLDGADSLDGLRGEVTLERDVRGRATVRASSRDDLAFGLGYLHGQDRFFQMDLLRRIGSGTLAELIGPAGIGADQGARRHDLAGTAEGAHAVADAREQALLEAYARGVNAGLASLKTRPWEYLLLRQTPMPWRAVDSFHVVLAMFRDLHDETNRYEQALDLASRALHPAVFALLTMTPGPWEAPIEGEAGRWPTAFIPRSGPGRSTGSAGSDDDVDGPADTPESVIPGSNAFAVGGSHTADGRALLANDMHLALGVPPTWYAVRLQRTGDVPLDAVGVTLPGAPALVAGSNGHVAWGLTNSEGDWLDHVVLDPDPRDPLRYRTPEGWRTLERRIESIAVAGGDRVTLEIWQSIWGPVVGEDPDGRPLALRWVAQEPEALNLCLVEMMEQKTARQALDLAPRCGVPAQNLLVADSRGEVGWTILGRVPRRQGLDGPRPRSWADGKTGWSGWLAPEEVPRIGPDREARLWTANARVVDLDAQRLLGAGRYDLGARARRIRDRLFERDTFDEPALFDIQLDTRAELMALWYNRLRALIEERPPSPERESLLGLLADWTGKADVDSVAYRLAREWRSEVTGQVLRALDEPLRPLARKAGTDAGIADMPRTEMAVWAILRDRPAWVPAGYRDWPDLEAASLRRVLNRWGDAKDWPEKTWGARSRTAITHPLSPLFPDWLRARLDMPARAVPGDTHVPRVAMPAFGASQRMVVAPGAEVRGILHLPGGANAHPFSSARQGDYAEWVAGEAVPLRPGPAVHRRVLGPTE
jgi:penicillin G amidase